MTGDPWLTETYFDWLRSEAFKARVNRTQYEGLLRVLHDIPFYYTVWQDENRVGDAMSFRQYEFLSFQDDLDSLDQVWLGQWAMAAPSTLEVLLAIARRWCYYFGGEVHFYFGHLFRNMGFDHFPGRVLSTHTVDQITERVEDWLSRQFSPNGVGSPFPVDESLALDIVDMRELDIWAQMNAYSAVHFQ